MYDFIAIVGVDCSGKSTLIEQLSYELKFRVLKGSSFTDSQCTNQQLFEKFSKMTTEHDVIFDRFIYCNEVYASLYDDFAILSDEQRRIIESRIKDRALIIYLEADMGTLVERLNSRGDDYVKADKLQAIKDKYKESLSKVDGIEVLKFNTTYASTRDIVKIVKQFIKGSYD